MTEINWSFVLYRAGAVATTGAISTVDLSFPETIFNRMQKQYGADRIVIRDSKGRMWEKVWD